MALSTYSELQTAVRDELEIDTSGLAATAIVDAITRAEAKINRRTRLREAEKLSTVVYEAATTAIENRLIALPTGFVEMINLRFKKSSETDDKYEQAQYVDARVIARYYTTSTEGAMYYTLRDQLEISRSVAQEHEIMMHYLKKWDIANDSTNWLLTNYPDVYLYGALAECEMHVRNDERVVLWKAYFDNAIDELNNLDQQSRDDVQLDVSELAYVSRREIFSIQTG